MNTRNLISPEEEHINNHTVIPFSSQDCLLSYQTKRRHFGKNLVFCWFQSQPLFNIGPQWPLFLLSFMFLESVGIIVYYSIISFAALWMKLVLLGITSLEALTFLYTALRNPGIASAVNPNEPNFEELEKYSNFCKKCVVLRDVSTFHCEYCDVCIQGYDHHCPWVGKCIGAKNKTAFHLFIFVTLAYFAVCLAIIIKKIVSK